MTEEPSYTELMIRECLWVFQSNSEKLITAFAMAEHGGDEEVSAVHEVYEAVQTLEQILKVCIDYYNISGMFPPSDPKSRRTK